MAKKKVLLLGAAGLVAPHITAGLERHFELRLADIQPHPGGREQLHVDIGCYEQVLAAARGMDAIFNFTVNRGHPVLSFTVNVLGAYHVLRAAVELGIRRIVHTGPQSVIGAYQHDFDVDDPPPRPGAGYYGITKHLSNELCRVFARAHDLQIVCFLFNGLRARPEGPIRGEDFPAFTVVWEDLVEACRLAVEADARAIAGGFQILNLHSHQGHGKYLLDKAARVLGFRPLEPVERLYRRRVG